MQLSTQFICNNGCRRLMLAAIIAERVFHSYGVEAVICDSARKYISFEIWPIPDEVMKQSIASEIQMKLGKRFKVFLSDKYLTIQSKETS